MGFSELRRHPPQHLGLPFRPVEIRRSAVFQLHIGDLLGAAGALRQQRLELNVQPLEGQREGYELKLNSYDLGDVAAFDARIRKELGDEEVAYTVEPKIDGVAVAVRYRDGRLDIALTRGDGRQGDVITENAATIGPIASAQCRGVIASASADALRETFGLRVVCRDPSAAARDSAAHMGPKSRPSQATNGTNNRAHRT